MSDAALIPTVEACYSAVYTKTAASKVLQQGGGGLNSTNYQSKSAQVRFT